MWLAFTVRFADFSLVSLLLLLVAYNKTRPRKLKCRVCMFLSFIKSVFLPVDNVKSGTEGVEESNGGEMGAKRQ